MTQHRADADAPDSLHAWLAATSAFIAGFVAFGAMYSFGVFFTPMEAEFRASRTATSVFFAITGVLFYSFGSVAGRLSDALGPRPIIAAGAVIIGAGLAGTAAAPQMWTGYLTYGAGVGIGAACAYTSRPWRSSADGSSAIAQRLWASPRPARDSGHC